MHWHGLRLENKYDGVPHETQQPIPIGGSFTYRIQFPDPGLYWYHPHIREDYTQEMGLYGNIIVEPSEPGYWPAANRDVVLTLDDVLLEDGKIATFSVAETSYAAMGRYGNLLLIGGQTDLTLTARAGEVLRLWLTNTANTRVFNVRLPGARMKLIGGDSGRVEREEFVSEVLLAPSERAVVDVLLDQPGELTLEHQTPNRTYPLASISVAEQPAEPSLTDQFEQLRTAPELAAERRQLDHWLAAAPDKILALVAEMDDPTAPQPGTGPTVYACPMHPEVTSDQPGRCPKCGMKLLATATARGRLRLPDAPGGHQRPAGTLPEVRHETPRYGHARGRGQLRLPDAPGRHQRPAGTLPTMRDEAARRRIGHPPSRSRHASRSATPPSLGHDAEDHGMEHQGMHHGDAAGARRRSTRLTRCPSTGGHEHGSAGHRMGRRHGGHQQADHHRQHALEIRGSDHRRPDSRDRLAVHRRRPGQDPTGQRDGLRPPDAPPVPPARRRTFPRPGPRRSTEPNLVWKDTVLVRTGQTVDILFDVTNPGLWMAHCHIAEHMQSGMMFSFTVDRGAAR